MIEVHERDEKICFGRHSVDFLYSRRDFQEPSISSREVPLLH